MTKQEVDRAMKLLNRWQNTAVEIGAGPVEIAWASATLAGNVIAQVSGLNCEAFAENVSKAKSVLCAQAEAMFRRP